MLHTSMQSFLAESAAEVVETPTPVSVVEETAALDTAEELDNTERVSVEEMMAQLETLQEQAASLELRIAEAAVAA